MVQASVLLLCLDQAGERIPALARNYATRWALVLWRGGNWWWRGRHMKKLLSFNNFSIGGLSSGKILVDDYENPVFFAYLGRK